MKKHELSGTLKERTMKERFEKWADEKGWKIIKSTDVFINDELLVDKTNVHLAQWLEFISNYKDIVNGSEDKCFITLENSNDSEWRQNDFEKMSLEASDGDDEWTAEIKSFWEKRFVIIMSVSGEYEYYAINTETGEIEHEYGPEFEESEIVSPTFKDFVYGIVNEEIYI